MQLEVGQSYRLRRDFEIRDEQSGTMRDIIRKGAVVKVKKVDEGAERVWVEGHNHSLWLDAFVRAVDLVS